MTQIIIVNDKSTNLLLIVVKKMSIVLVLWDIISKCELDIINLTERTYKNLIQV